MATTTAELEARTMHHQARKNLLERVRNDWPSGTRLPPIQQLAKDLRIGFNSTHRAVQQLVEEGVLSSRPRIGTFVADRSRGMLAMEKGRTENRTRSRPQGHLPLAGKTVRCYFEGPSTDSFVLQGVNAFESHLAEHGCVLLRRHLDNMQSDCGDTAGLDGVAIFNANSSSLIHVDPRLVVVAVNTGAVTPLDRTGRFDIVTVDQNQSAYLAGRHLRESGCKSVCVIGRRSADHPSRFDGISSARLGGFERGWKTVISPSNLLPVHAYTICGGASAVEPYLQMNPRPEGIFAASDDLAVGFVAAASSHGLLPGRDYDIIGFDRQGIGQGLPNGVLTTVEVPIEQMGKQAAFFLADRPLDPDRPARHLSLSCSLYEGSTVRMR
jgi:DNA-binding LacI/PurR family transcriptional regulator